MPSGALRRVVSGKVKVTRLHDHWTKIAISQKPTLWGFTGQDEERAFDVFAELILLLLLIQEFL